MSFSKSLFAGGGKIASSLGSYETRPQQIQMAEAVEEAIRLEKNLIVEAGTGVGKSLAYLVPFIEWATKENKKVVVSTYTKALQSQLFIKDLPFLSHVMETPFKYAISMGSDNYACLRKVHAFPGSDLFDTKKRKKQFERLLSWINETDTGLITDADFSVDRGVWDKFARESDMCLGGKCSHKNECFYRKMRIKQQDAHVIVTNHSLLFASMMSESQVLPDFHALVLDEAHTLESVATNHFGKGTSSSALENLSKSMTHLLSDGLSASSRSGFSGEIEEAKKTLKSLEEATSALIKKAESILGKEDIVVSFSEDRPFMGTDEAAISLEEASISLMKLSGAIDNDEESEIVRTYSNRCLKLSEALDFIFSQKDENYVYWASVTSRRGGVNYSFHAAPIDISEHMRVNLFERVCPVVLTSATLSLSSSKADFTFIKNQLGLDSPMELEVGSPFDYENNVLIYMPKGIADPNQDFSTFKRQVQDDIVRLYEIMGGRIFALFTSYDMLNAVAQSIAEERQDINILRQGDLPRYVLLDVFKKNHNSILMGTTTFWQGVDVSGSALECVVITKLPFSVPNDPINAARIKSIKEKGLNPFTEYQIPQALIMFKQGFGRLIRRHSDRGVVAILDPRVRSRYYGREFISALPKCKETDKISDVEGFFRQEIC